MPLTNDVIIKLNEITNLIEDKDSLKDSDVGDIKNIFGDLAKKGTFYDVDDIESWFENEGSWKNKDVIVRITNISHYIQSKHEQIAQFRIISDDDSCSCEN